jgi:hypothetical protein
MSRNRNHGICEFREVFVMLKKWITYSSMLIIISGFIIGTIFTQDFSAAGMNSHLEQSLLAMAEIVPELERQIRTGQTTTADEIIPVHPRIWLRGPEGWDKDKFGSYAWRIVHGPAMSMRYPSFAHDDAKYAFYDAANLEDEVFNQTDWSDVNVRLMALITLGKAVSLDSEWNLPRDLPSTSLNPDYNPKHTSDEYYSRAKEKLLFLANAAPAEKSSEFMVQVGAAAYDWLIVEMLSNGQPVFSDAERTNLQNRLVAHAEYLKSRCTGGVHFFQSAEVYSCTYPLIGMALYEPNGEGISSENNARAKDYLDDFDSLWIGKILPVLNEQGGDGGWVGGITRTSGDPGMIGGTDPDNTMQVVIAPLLFAHFTATGREIEDSLFSTGFMKYFIEWQLYMIPPASMGNATYYPIGGAWSWDERAPWVFPRRVYTRRRASQDAEQLRLAELGAWLGYMESNYFVGRSGSWDCNNRLLFEDNWVNPRSAEELGYGTKHFEKLGWVFLREGFADPNDLSGIFVSQRYRWSHLDEIAQNSFFLERKGELIQGWDNTIWIDDDGRRNIRTFPTLADGINAYAPGSTYDIGPGISGYQNNDTFTYLLGDATNGYDPAKLSKYTRQVVFIKPDIFVIFDNVVTTSASIKKSWVIDPGATPQSIGNNVYTITNGNGELWIKALSPQPTTVESQTATQFKITASANAVETIFVHVMQAVDAGSNASQVSADDATLTQEGDWFHIQVAGHTVSFNHSGEFTFDGNPTELRGDLNRDGIINDADISLCTMVILKHEINPDIVARADVNKNGFIDSTDVQWIVNQALGQ